MNKAETRAELIDPALTAKGWGSIENSKILRERDVCKITDGRIQVGGVRKKPLIADYILVFKGIKLAVVEAKNNELEVGDGVALAKLYAEKLPILLQTKYQSLEDAMQILGEVSDISSMFIEFQKYLYEKIV